MSRRLCVEISAYTITITDSSFSFVIGVPQLFFRLAGFNTPLPESCADIYLKVEYIEA